MEFLGGLAAAGGWRPPADLPEVALVGRSNVGKSSLLNSVLRRRAVARVSRTPGRTREINFFRVNDAFVIADLPGYGYARISKEQHAGWKQLAESYLAHTPMLKGVVQLLDVRHDPTSDDRVMLDYLADLGTPTIVVVTKTDKLSRGACDARLESLRADLGLDADQVIAFSATSGAGRDDLAAAIVALVEQPSRDSEAQASPED